MGDREVRDLGRRANNVVIDGDDDNKTKAGDHETQGSALSIHLSVCLSSTIVYFLLEPLDDHRVRS